MDFTYIINKYCLIAVKTDMAVAVYLVELIGVTTIVILLTLLASVLIILEKILYALLFVIQPTIHLLELCLLLFEDGFLYAINSFSSIMHVDDAGSNSTVSEVS